MDDEVLTFPRSGSPLQDIGNTPLVSLKLAQTANVDARIFAKLESANPGGSIKDRPVLRMLTQAMSDGRFDLGRGLLECTAGDAGISYAMIGAALGIPVTLVVYGHTSQEQIDRMAAHGAELIIMDPLVDHDTAMLEAERMANEFPARYWLCDQYHNPSNWQAHYYGTAKETLAQLTQYIDAIPDALVVGVDTGGTLTGMGRKLREANPTIHIAVVVPENFPGMEGWQPLGQLTETAPKLLFQSLIHERIPVTLEDARLICQDLAHEGLFVGPSSGAFVYGALQLAASRQYRNIVTVLPDAGERYTSTGMWRRQSKVAEIRPGV